MADNYERVYDVNLLDDIHNYFPALLYQTQNFSSVSDILQYVQQKTQQRFNLFDYGRRQYFRQQAPSNITRTPSTIRRDYTDPRYTTQNAYETTMNDMRAADFQSIPIVATPILQTPVRSPSAALQSAVLPLLRSLNINAPARVIRTSRGNEAWASLGTLYQDVVVHATQELINGASQERMLETDIDNDCAICQDHMRQGELVRVLTGCQHQFHRVCIDNWLLNESVICPTCRHDIRQPARPASASARGTPQLTGEQPPSIPNTIPDITGDTGISSSNTSTADTVRRSTLRSRETDEVALEDAMAVEILNTILGRGTLGLGLY
jgi:hypothetical protein